MNNVKNLNRERNVPPKQPSRPPRENERRAPEKKPRGKKTAVCIALIFAVAAAALLIGIVPVNQIKVENNKRYSAEEIQKAGGLSLGGNVLIYKLNEAEEMIVRELPYIQSAQIKRGSGGVVINVTECSAKYALRQGGKYLLLSNEMKILELGADKVPKGAVIVSGLEPTGVALGRTLEAKNKTGIELLNKTVGILSELKISDITEINVSDVNNIELWYQNRLQLIIGGEDDMEYNLSFAKETIKRENAVDPKQSGRFDFSEHGKAHFTPYIPTTVPDTRPTETTIPPSAQASQPATAEVTVPAE